MLVPKTVVINCAGTGERLGMNIPKSLVNVCGKPMIHWQLEMLSEIEDVRIVIGFKAKEMLETVFKVRRDICFRFNHDYGSTGTAHSLALGAMHAKNTVLSLDGDLLVHPEDLRTMLQAKHECLGVSPPTSDEPVYVQLDSNGNQINAKSFSRISGDAEWTGLVQLAPEKIKAGYHHVYHLLETHLPIRALEVRTREIDTPNDYNEAVKWVEKLINQGVLHG